MVFYIAFCTESLKSVIYFVFHSIFQLQQTTFQMLSRHMWLVATVWTA